MDRKSVLRRQIDDISMSYSQSTKFISKVNTTLHSSYIILSIVSRIISSLTVVKRCIVSRGNRRWVVHGRGWEITGELVWIVRLLFQSYPKHYNRIWYWFKRIFVMASYRRRQ